MGRGSCTAHGTGWASPGEDHPSPVHQVLNWVWPPAMLALAVWMIVCVRIDSCRAELAAGCCIQ